MMSSLDVFSGESSSICREWKYAKRVLNGGRFLCFDSWFTLNKRVQVRVTHVFSMFGGTRTMFWACFLLYKFHKATSIHCRILKVLLVGQVAESAGLPVTEVCNLQSVAVTVEI